MNHSMQTTEFRINGMSIFLWVVLAVVMIMYPFTYSQGAELVEVPTEGQIAAIIVTANDIDIETSSLAKRSKNHDVKGLAKHVQEDHLIMNQEADLLIKKLNLKPEKSILSKSMKEEAKIALKDLQELKDEEFDKAYIDRQVTFYKQMLNSLDYNLLINAKTAELKEFLERTRVRTENHLNLAKSLQPVFSRGKTAQQ